jgi:hypothetical protein
VRLSINYTGRFVSTVRFRVSPASSTVTKQPPGLGSFFVESIKVI